MKPCLLCLSLISAVLLSANRQAQSTEPVTEMAKLAKALVGEWNTTETMEPSKLSPKGASRQGKVHVRLAAGGTTLIYEVHSDGSAGKLDGMLIVWWQKESNSYGFFTCFNDPRSPCRIRGTAHWEGEAFVNDYDDAIKGKNARWRDTFTFTPTTHTLIAAMEVGDGTMKTMITTKGIRVTAHQ